MIEAITASSTADTGSQDGSARPTVAQPAAPRPVQAPADAGIAAAAASPTRLLIDQDKDTGAFVYRIVDAVDGRLLAEIPRESLDQLKQADDYAAGAVISTLV